MPRSSPTPPRTEIPAELREMGTRARRLAREVSDPPAQANLIAFAEELEARAAALETAPQTVSHQEAATAQRSDPDLGQS